MLIARVSRVLKPVASQRRRHKACGCSRSIALSSCALHLGEGFPCGWAAMLRKGDSLRRRRWP